MGDLGAIVNDYLSHPRYRAAQQVVLRAILGRAEAVVEGTVSAGPDEAAWAYYVTSWQANLARGKLRAALDNASLPELNPRWREYVLYVVLLTGRIELPQRWEGVLTANAAADSSGEPTSHDFYAGAYAADRGRWEDHRAALARLRRNAETSAARGDSATAGAIEGYGLWRRGRAAEALPLLQSAQRRLPPNQRNTIVRWWLGRLLLEVGQPQEAQRYFASLAHSVAQNELEVPATYFLAKTHEAQGEYERAREAYAYVALSWSDADDELQPVVEDARAAAARLSKLIPETD